MIELGILIERLHAIQRLYDGAAAAFVDKKRKIELGEEPYEEPPFNPDTDDPEPPFLEDWNEADEFQNVIGQACISMLHSCLKDYLDEILRRSGIKKEADRLLSKRRNEMKGESWFGRYVAVFADAYSIDWGQSPIPTEEIEALNLARNDIQHGRQAHRLNRYLSEQHTKRFPLNLFLDDYERHTPIEYRAHGLSRIYVSPEALQESIRRVESFCTFVESRTASYRRF